MMKFVHVLALVASLLDQHAHVDHIAHELDVILGHLNSRRSIVRN